jgi:thioester reductase-like protein
MTPVDYVAEAICFLTTQKKDIYSVYHLTNPSIRRYNEILGILKRCGYEIELVEPEEYTKRLKMRQLRTAEGNEYHSMTTELIQAHPAILQEETKTYADCFYTQLILESAGIVCPKIDEDLLRTYINYCERIGYINRQRIRL